jgi:hypothetical protein
MSNFPHRTYYTKRHVPYTRPRAPRGQDLTRFRVKSILARPLRRWERLYLRTSDIESNHTNDVRADQPKMPIKRTAIYTYFFAGLASLASLANVF